MANDYDFLDCQFCNRAVERPEQISSKADCVGFKGTPDAYVFETHWFATADGPWAETEQGGVCPDHQRQDPTIMDFHPTMADLMFAKSIDAEVAR